MTWNEERFLVPCAFLGALVGVAVGGYNGFLAHGVGGALVWSIPGVLLGGYLGALLGGALGFLPEILAWVFALICWSSLLYALIWVVESLWDVGKP